MPDTTKDPLNVPLAASSDDEPVAAILNQSHPVQGDQRIDPDPTLQGYQEDIGAGGGNDVLENETGTSPSDLTLMSPAELKPELDKLAIDEHEATPESGFAEDDRESIEDLDEGDKRDA